MLLTRGLKESWFKNVNLTMTMHLLKLNWPRRYL